MQSRTTTLELVHWMSEAASVASERLIPAPIMSAVDRTLVDVACASRGLMAVAEQLSVDPPAVDAWRRLGVPTTFRPRLAALIVAPDLHLHQHRAA